MGAPQAGAPHSGNAAALQHSPAGAHSRRQRPNQPGPQQQPQKAPATTARSATRRRSMTGVPLLDEIPMGRAKIAVGQETRLLDNHSPQNLSRQPGPAQEK